MLSGLLGKKVLRMEAVATIRKNCCQKSKKSKILSAGAMQQLLRHVEEGLFGGRGCFDLVEQMERFVELLGDEALGGLLDIELAIDVENLGDFGLAVGRLGGVELGERLSLLLVGGGEGLQVEIGLLVVADVGACLFAKGGHIAVGVEEVVLQLERQTEMDAKLIDGLLVEGGGVGIEGSEFQSTRQKDGGLEANHVEILVGGDVVA